jgi:hypothetical protein
MSMPRHGDDEADRQNMIFVILLFFIKWLIDGVSLNGGLIGIQPEFWKFPVNFPVLREFDPVLFSEGQGGRADRDVRSAV